MKIKSVKFNFIMNFILTASNFIFPLITFPYVSRVLGASGTGKVSFAISVVSYFTMVAALGIPTSNAINMFYKQIILQRGLPFELKSPENASGQLDRLEACILSCSIYSG